jgi:hypothetical protein
VLDPALVGDGVRRATPPQSVGEPGGLFGAGFHRAIRDGARRSAEVVVPLVLGLMRPRSVIDVGCALGSWLAVFREHGIEDVWGVEGAHLDRTRLEIPAERLLVRNLEHPFSLDRRFDLVVCLEVAEHLSPRAAEPFIASLTQLGPVVLFSAAIPFQGGVRHFNEQWPEYWAALFQARGYLPVDCIRRKIWTDTRVSWWYAQNLLAFVARDRLSEYPALAREQELTDPLSLARVHPRLYLHWVARARG